MIAYTLVVLQLLLLVLLVSVNDGWPKFLACLALLIHTIGSFFFLQRGR